MDGWVVLLWIFWTMVAPEGLLSPISTNQLISSSGLGLGFGLVDLLLIKGKKIYIPHSPANRRLNTVLKRKQHVYVTYIRTQTKHFSKKQRETSKAPKTNQKKHVWKARHKKDGKTVAAEKKVSLKYCMDPAKITERSRH